jgi:hypothetical protein
MSRVKNSDTISVVNGYYHKADLQIRRREVPSWMRLGDVPHVCTPHKTKERAGGQIVYNRLFQYRDRSYAVRPRRLVRSIVLLTFGLLWQFWTFGLDYSKEIQKH